MAQTVYVPDHDAYVEFPDATSIPEMEYKIHRDIYKDNPSWTLYKADDLWGKARESLNSIYGDKIKSAEAERAAFEEIPESFIGQRAIETEQAKIKPQDVRPPDWSLQEETAFKDWYKGWAETMKLNPNPDDELQKYDYREAFKAGATPDGTGHWPSAFKFTKEKYGVDHPNRFVPDETNTDAIFDTVNNKTIVPPKLREGEAPPTEEEKARKQVQRYFSLGVEGALRGLTVELPKLPVEVARFANTEIPNFLALLPGFEGYAKVLNDVRSAQDDIVENNAKYIVDKLDLMSETLYGKEKELHGVERAIYEGSKMIAPSLIPTTTAITGTRAVFGIGKMLKTAKQLDSIGHIAEATKLFKEAGDLAKAANSVGSAGAAVLYGMQQAQNTRDQAEKSYQYFMDQGMPEEAATAREAGKGMAPYINGVIEGAGEFFGTKYFGKLLRLDEAAVKTRGLKNTIYDLLKSMGVELSTEFGQALGQSTVEKYSGIRPKASPWEEALSVLSPTAFLTLLTGGLGHFSSLFRTKDMTAEKQADFLNKVISEEKKALDVEQEAKAKVPAEEQDDAVREVMRMQGLLPGQLEEEAPAEEPTIVGNLKPTPEFGSLMEAMEYGVKVGPERVAFMQTERSRLLEEANVLHDQGDLHTAAQKVSRAMKLREAVAAAEDPERYAQIIETAKAPTEEAAAEVRGEAAAMTPTTGKFDINGKEERAWLKKLGYTEEQIDAAAKIPETRYKTHKLEELPEVTDISRLEKLPTKQIFEELAGKSKGELVTIAKAVGANYKLDKVGILDSIGKAIANRRGYEMLRGKGPDMHGMEQAAAVTLPKPGDMVQWTDAKGKLQKGKVRDFDKYSGKVWIFPQDKSLVVSAEAAVVEVPVSKLVETLAKPAKSAVLEFLREEDGERLYKAVSGPYKGGIFTEEMALEQGLPLPGKEEGAVERVPAKTEYAGYQEGVGHMWTPLYGQHAKSTMSARTMKERGYPVPEVPDEIIEKDYNNAERRAAPDMNLVIHRPKAQQSLVEPEVIVAVSQKAYEGEKANEILPDWLKSAAKNFPNADIMIVRNPDTAKSFLKGKKVLTVTDESTDAAKILAKLSRKHKDFTIAADVQSLAKKVGTKFVKGEEIKALEYPEGMGPVEEVMADEEEGPATTGIAPELLTERAASLHKVGIAIGAGKHKGPFLISMGVNSGTIYGPLSKRLRNKVKTETKEKVTPVLGKRETITKHTVEIDGVTYNWIDAPLLPNVHKTRIEKIKELTRQFKDALGWYKEEADFIKNYAKVGVSQEELTKYVKILAILSQGKSPYAAQTDFGKVMESIAKNDKVLGGPGKGLSQAQADKINTVWDNKDTDKTLEDFMNSYGAKIGSMVFVMTNPMDMKSNAVVVDRHMGRPWGYNFVYNPEGKQSFRVPDRVRREIRDDTVQAAEEISQEWGYDVPANAVQAAMWYAAGAGRKGGATRFSEAIQMEPKKSLGMRLFELITAGRQQIVSWQTSQHMEIRGMERARALTSQEARRLEELEKKYREPSFVNPMTDVEQAELLKLRHITEGDTPRPWSRNDVKRRMEAHTEANPYVALGYWYVGGARKESFFAGKVPHLTTIYENEIYDAEQDPSQYWAAARKRANQDPDVVAGKRTSDQVLVNAFANMLKETTDFKGFLYAQGNNKVVVTFEAYPVEQLGEKVTTFTSDIVHSATKMPDSLQETWNMSQMLLPDFGKFVKSTLTHSAVESPEDHVALSHFAGSEGTDGNNEYSIEMDLRGPIDAIRAMLSIMGASKKQNSVMLLRESENPTGTLVEFQFKAKDLAVIEKALKEFGFDDFNIVMKPGAVTFSTYFDRYNEMSERSADIARRVTRMAEKYGKPETFETSDVALELITADQYEANITKHYGAKQGGTIYERATLDGDKWAAESGIRSEIAAVKGGVSTQEVGEGMGEGKGKGKSKGKEHLSDAEATAVAASAEHVAFQKWFRDSVVVDARGKPLIVYHGTRVPITEFREGAREGGIYFTADTSFANYATRYHIEGVPSIVPAYLQLKNPYMFDYNTRAQSLAKTIELAKKQGNDGVVVKNWPESQGEGDTYVVFSSKQIKSVFNQGTWSEDSKNISAAATALSTRPVAFAKNALQIVNQEQYDKLMKIIDQVLATLPKEVADKITVLMPKKISKQVISEKSKKSHSELAGKSYEEGNWLIEGSSGESQKGLAYLIRLSLEPYQKLFGGVNFYEFSERFTKTAYHETYHVAEKWLLTEKALQQMQEYMPNTEERAKRYAAWAMNEKRFLESYPSTPQVILRSWLSMKHFFEKFGSLLRGTGWFSVNDVFRNVFYQKYVPHYGVKAADVIQYSTPLAEKFDTWYVDLSTMSIDNVKPEHDSFLTAGTQVEAKSKLERTQKIFDSGERFFYDFNTEDFSTTRPKHYNYVAVENANDAFLTISDARNRATSFGAVVEDPDNVRAASTEADSQDTAEQRMDEFNSEPVMMEEDYLAPDNPALIEMPELIQLVLELNGGKYPRVFSKVRGPFGEGARIRLGDQVIDLNTELFTGKDQYRARAALARMIGHIVDYLPEGKLGGTLLGKIAQLKSVIGQYLAPKPGMPGELTWADKLRLYNEAKKFLEAGKRVTKLIDEEIEKEIGLTPEDITDIWNQVEKAKTMNPELYKYIAGLPSAAKKNIVKEALKGMIASELKRFVNTIKVKTGQKIMTTVENPYSQADIVKLATQYIEQEIQKRQLWVNSELRDELKNLTRKWRPFPGNSWELKPEYVAFRDSSDQLFADALSVLLNNPMLLKRAAPKFYAAFFNWIDNNPRFRDLYRGIQSSIRAGTVERSRVERTYKNFDDGNDAFFELMEQKPMKIKDGLMRELFDVYHFILSDLGKVNEREIPVSENPRYRLEDMVYSMSEAEAYLINIKHTVKKILDENNLKWDREFGLTSYLRRVVMERYELANPEGWDTRTAMKQLRAMQNVQLTKGQSTALRQAIDNFRKIRVEMFIKKARAADVFSDDLMKKIEDAESYVTFNVLDYLEKKFGTAVSSRIHHQVGTFKPVANPATATIMKDVQMIKMINRNSAIRSIVKFYQKNADIFPGKIVVAETRWNNTYKHHEIVEPKDPKMGLLVYMYKGKAYGYYVPKEIAETMQFNPYNDMALARVFRSLATPFRKLFTEYNPGFWLFNVQRDFLRAYGTLPKASAVGFAAEWLKALKPAFRSAYGIPDPVVQEMQKGNMLISIADYHGMKREDTQLERMLKSMNLMGANVYGNKVMAPFGHLYNFVTNFGRIFDYYYGNAGKGLERATKIAGYNYIKKLFPDMPTQAVAHIVRNTGSPDFLRRGRSHTLVNNLLLFSNAIKEGYRGDWEAFQDKPFTYTRKKLMVVAVPKLIMAAMLAGLLGDDLREIMEGVSEYDLANYICIPLGVTKSGQSVYLRSPTDEISRFMGGVIWKLARSPEMGLWETAKQLTDYFAGQVPTANPVLGIVWDILDYASGQNPFDRFYGRHAVNDDVFAAGGWRSHKQFGEYVASKLGGSILYRFKHDDVDKVAQELESVVGFPFSSQVADWTLKAADQPVIVNILGRFLKVSDAGRIQAVKREIKEIRRENMTAILDAKEAVVKWANGEPLTPLDALRIATKPDIIERNVLVTLARKYSNTYLDLYLSASSKQEKWTVIKHMLKREGIVFDKEMEENIKRALNPEKIDIEMLKKLSPEKLGSLQEPKSAEPGQSLLAKVFSPSEAQAAEQETRFEQGRAWQAKYDKPEYYRTTIDQVKETHPEVADIPTEMVLAVIETESQFRPGVKSSAGAMGLMQVKPSTFKEQYNRANKPMGKIKDPAANILGGMLYLRELKAKYKTWEKALEAYNIGPTALNKGEQNLSYVYKVLYRKGKYEEEK